MAIEINAATPLADDPLARALISILSTTETQETLGRAVIYYNFPLYASDEGSPIAARILLLSDRCGAFLFETCVASGPTATTDLRLVDERLSATFGHLFSRLIKTKALRKSKQELALRLDSAIYAPNFRSQASTENRVLSSDNDILAFIHEQEHQIPVNVFDELVSTAEGSKGLVRTKPRSPPPERPNSRGALAAEVEAEITGFDQQQKQGALISLDGPQRIRGLAGSGKTIVLTMKAAVLHLSQPDATILYTFYTRSLYGTIRRLITRFYRQFDDRDPDWTRLKIRHAWGGSSSPGVYYEAARASGIPPLTFTEANNQSNGDPFDFACSSLLSTNRVRPTYDYVLLDEGQDFPPSFVRLCRAVAARDRFVIAYDELQTIFQSTAPTAAHLFGVNENGRAKIDFDEDVILKKCYRNPREILVCAHALGFGLYANRPAQMLENKDHWSDIGYDHVDGDFVGGSIVTLERPAQNSLTTLSNKNTIDQIISGTQLASLEDEVLCVYNKILEDIKDGLRPDDIAVVVVDDRAAVKYLTGVERLLSQASIPTNNIHQGRLGPTDFSAEGHVTLATVHKAKGNEAYSVYVMGVDALFPNPTVRSRNMLFVAMTRAKGWVHLTGVGESVQSCFAELRTAKMNFPRLKFTYPTTDELMFMKRDLEKAATRKQRAERLLTEALAEMTDEEVTRFLRDRGITKYEAQGKNSRPSKHRKHEDSDK